jgi:RNA polymerase sigma-70 factor (ECF subfamily)
VVSIADARPVERDEAQMIAAILAGDRELYHRLIQPYELSVYRMALSFVKNETEAEDVAQEAFMKAFRDLANFRGESKFSTWLISITLNEARRRLRRQGTVRTKSLDAPPEEGGKVSPALLRDWREIPSEALERSEIRELLQRAIEQLSPIYREVLVLRDIEELSTEETAGVLAISISSVKVRLHRARIMLQKELAPKLKLASPKKGCPPATENACTRGWRGRSTARTAARRSPRGTRCCREARCGIPTPPQQAAASKPPGRSAMTPNAAASGSGVSFSIATRAARAACESAGRHTDSRRTRRPPRSPSECELRRHAAHREISFPLLPRPASRSRSPTAAR